MFEWTLSLSSLVTAISILLAGAAVYWKSYYDIKAFKISLISFKEDLSELKVDVKILNKLITDMALQQQRLDNQAERMSRLERQLDDFSHGKGFIKNV